MFFLWKVYLVLLIFYCSLNGYSDRLVEWVVIGAGPGGISAVGTLLDYGIDGRSLLWVDQAFNGGAIALYPAVSSNTKANIFKSFFIGCRSFGMYSLLQTMKLSGYDDEIFCPLGDVHEALVATTQNLLRKVNHCKGCVDRVIYEGHCYKIIIGSRTFDTKKLVLAQGCVPKLLHYKAPIINLVDALNKEKLRQLVCSDDIVVVFGASHSGILVLKNLCELNVKKIISIANRPLRFAEERDGKYFYDNSGLKGVAAEWARDVFENNLPTNMTKFMNPSDQECVELVASATKIIYAVGFDMNPITGLSSDILKSYNPTTGIIRPGLFGIGFAFPERVDDASGNQEYAVGLFDFLQYAQTVVPLWLKTGEK